MSSSGVENSFVGLMSWEQKSCRKEQKLLWKLEGGYILDQTGLALTVSYAHLADLVGRTLLCNKTTSSTLNTMLNENSATLSNQPNTTDDENNQIIQKDIKIDTGTKQL